MHDASRRIVTRTPATEAEYVATVGKLVFKARCVMPDAVDYLAATIVWFRERHDTWAPATIRQYRAALLYCVSSDVLAGVREEHEGADLIQSLKDGPRPLVGGEARTSARKRRDVSDEELRALSAELADQGPDGELASGLLWFGTALGLRPIEWQKCQIFGDFLVVKNAKSTNGRGLGEARRLDLSAMPDDDRRQLELFISRYQLIFDREEDARAFHSRIADRIARCCDRLGIARIALYTTRHAAIAGAKAEFTDKAAVAAFAGHRTTATAYNHYAKKKKGSMIACKAKPHPRDIELVQKSPKDAWEANFLYRASKQKQIEAVAQTSAGPQGAQQFVQGSRMSVLCFDGIDKRTLWVESNLEETLLEDNPDDACTLRSGLK